jgi:hypothetical protein
MNVIKAKFCDDLRRISFCEKPTYDSLIERLGTVFPKIAGCKISMKYVDGDGDYVTIASDSDRLESFSVADQGDRCLHYEILASEDGASNSTASESITAESKNNDDVSTWSRFLLFFGLLFIVGLRDEGGMYLLGDFFVHVMLCALFVGRHTFADILSACFGLLSRTFSRFLCYASPPVRFVLYYVCTFYYYVCIFPAYCLCWKFPTWLWKNRVQIFRELKEVKENVKQEAWKEQRRKEQARKEEQTATRRRKEQAGISLPRALDLFATHCGSETNPVGVGTGVGTGDDGGDSDSARRIIDALIQDVGAHMSGKTVGEKLAYAGGALQELLACRNSLSRDLWIVRSRAFVERLQCKVLDTISKAEGATDADVRRRRELNSEAEELLASVA